MTATERALMFLFGRRAAADEVGVDLFDRREATADEIGDAIWPDRDVRAGRGVAHGGGGYYAAQMLLGRLKKAGLVEHAPNEGSSARWRLTRRGINHVHDLNRR